MKIIFEIGDLVHAYINGEHRGIAEVYRKDRYWLYLYGDVEKARKEDCYPTDITIRSAKRS
jgi:hypothetical protein